MKTLRHISWTVISACLLVSMPGPVAAQNSAPYGDCSNRASHYEAAYYRSGNVRDLVCMQKALERELTRGTADPCPRSAQYYQDRYTSGGSVDDLVCMQKALERELL